jgi:hypothetical protein
MKRDSVVSLPITPNANPVETEVLTLDFDLA